MAMNIGLDTRRLLPPFMPVQRNQDGIFGRLLHLCFNGSCRGYAPYAIKHDPPNRSDQVDHSHALSVGPLRVPDVLEALLQPLYKWPFGMNSSSNLKVAGRYLYDISQLTRQAFMREVRKHCLDLTRLRIQHLKRCLNQKWNAPKYWKKDVKQVIANFRELALQENIGIPCDLPGNAEKRMVLFQELIRKFGQLLIYWPSIWETAKNYRRQGRLEAMST
ncbi:hypothetical protein NC796_21880 [Aliifodinibius sp. S!AR15-10]|uniref:hypothetical protein n=1 Tax=Aliifodinibius sp. S!AR15-10 TaxID=2950437 RepID=UPI002865CF6A|nr:hypothetical protein [Aliifodinibius sp. S!AR15-10]MDR8393818.1 hypothetical protein [Aliifodinibius sp. S!AR15-10]